MWLNCLACLADRRCIDDGQELLDVVDEEPVKEVLVPVLQCRQADVLLERVRLPRDIGVDPVFLLLHGAHGVRQEPFQPEVLPFLSVEGRPLRVHGMPKQPRAAVGHLGGSRALWIRI